jgi:4-amino-4-deoxy-L-arabinose transferase-like glycosyltransferase
MTDAPSVPEPTQQSLWDGSVAPFLERHFFLLCVLVIGIACVRIVSTYDALSLTVDEPFHLACGIQYLANHTYTIEAQHPPLARAAVALGPYLLGARPAGESDAVGEGLAILGEGVHPGKTIFFMRLGNLLFFVLGCCVVCAWARHFFGTAIGVLATALFTLTPAVLADAQLATTDMALGATVAAAFLSLIFWAEKPNWRRTRLLGFCAALACVSKFTALGYLPAAAALALVAYLWTVRPGFRRLRELAKERLVTVPWAGLALALTIWAAYFFSIGPVASPTFGSYRRIPAPEFFYGIGAALAHNRNGHAAYLLGHFQFTGWWYYFPVALAVKTPIAFLVLVVAGLVAMIRARNRLPCLLLVAFSIGILAPAMASNIDIGIRHIEPIWFGLSIIAAVGVRYLLEWKHAGFGGAVSASALAAWLVISVAVHHPDYIAYFNAFAGKQPEKILVDSNYDWGQDLKLLANRLHELGAQQVSLASAVRIPAHAVPSRIDYLESWYGLPYVTAASMCTPAPGWNVISTTVTKIYSHLEGSRFYRADDNSATPWYDQIAPDERLGPLLMFNIRPDQKFLSQPCHQPNLKPE